MPYESSPLLVERFVAKPEPRPSIQAYAASLVAQQRLTPVVMEAINQAEGARSDYRFVVYIAGALTGVSEAIKMRYVQLSDLIATQPGMYGYIPHLHGTDPIRHSAVTPAEVRDIDYLWATIVADAHVNFLTPLAHGNAIEAAWAEQQGIPAVYLAPVNATISRLVRGLRNVAGVVMYADFETDGLSQLQGLLSAVQARLPEHSGDQSAQVQQA
jgi:hypothetical protein